MINDHTSASPAQLAWRKFRRNKGAVVGLIILSLALLIAVLGALVRPDSSKDANSQNLSLSRKNVNFSVEVLKVRKNVESSTSPVWSRFFFGGEVPLYSEIALHSYEIVGDSVFGYTYGGQMDIKGLPFKYLLADVLWPIDLTQVWELALNQSITDSQGVTHYLSREEMQAEVREKAIYTKRFLLGTDKFGRDMLSRLMAGTIVSLSVGLISVLISLILGIGLGAMAGYFGGWVDDLITWLINVVWSIPTLLLVIAITFALGKGFVQVFIAVGLTMWVEVARVVRGQVLSLRNMEYIEAAQALGYSHTRIIYRHVIPNILGPVIVISAANFASAILLEAGLSFLGIGAQIPMASWGQMIKEHYAYITTDMAYLAILPGLCIVVLVLAFMLIGSGLRDSMDTRAAG